MFVEIDEAKFGKRKYNRGRRVEGQWVFGGIERGGRGCFLVPVAARNKETLTSLIETHIRPGSTIVSDCWKAYCSLEDDGWEHFRINHSIQFVDPDYPFIHTQNIERLWRDVRGSIPRYGVKDEHFVGYLAEFMFKRANKDNLMEVFFDTVKRMYPGP